VADIEFIEKGEGELRISAKPRWFRATVHGGIREVPIDCGVLGQSPRN